MRNKITLLRGLCLALTALLSPLPVLPQTAPPPTAPLSGAERVTCVQAGMPRPGSRAAHPPKLAQPLGAQALDAFDELGKAVRPGPLADAIARLLAHHGHHRS